MKTFHKISIVAVAFAALAVETYGQEFLSCSEDEHLMDPPDCPPLEIIPSYHPYPYDCTKFFICSNGVARCIQCPTGTRWDQNLNICNHIAVIDCVIVTTSSPNGTTIAPPTDATTTVLPVTNATTTVSPVTNATVPITNATTTTVSPITNATTTVSPITNATVPITNATTTVSPITNATTTVSPVTNATTTVSPVTNATTTVSPITNATTPVSPITNATTTSLPITNATTTVSPTTNAPPSTDPADCVCPEEYAGNTGHPFDCSKYYVCRPGQKPCLVTCADGLYFSPITLDCEWEWDVPSCQGGTPPPPTGNPFNYRNIRRIAKSVLSRSSLKNSDPCEA